MSVIRVQCRQCFHMILPETAERTGGLCMPCWKKAEDIRREQWRAKFDTGLSHDVPLRKVGVPQRVYDLAHACEAYCIIDCCGFHASGFSHESVTAHLATLSPVERAELQTQFRAMANAVDACAAPFTALGDEYTVEKFHDMMKPVADVLYFRTTNA